MTLFAYFILMLISTIFSWLGWGTILFYLNPQEAGNVGFAFFYGSLFLALTGSFSLLGLFIRMRLLKDDIVSRQVAISFRQAVFFAILLVGSLFLRSKDLLAWWNIILLIFLLTFLEFFFLSYQRRR